MDCDHSLLAQNNNNNNNDINGKNNNEKGKHTNKFEQACSLHIISQFAPLKSN